MVNFLNFFRHVLPKNKDGSWSEAFKLAPDTTHEKLYIGLSTFPQDIKDNMDAVFFDIFPDTTQSLDEWVEAFDIWPSIRTDQETRDALTSAWRATGGQSPRYLQDRLQEAGFDVYVHDWWGAIPPANTVIFDFEDRCYYTDGGFPGTSEFTEGRSTRAWKERNNAIVEFDPFVIRDGADLGLLTEPQRTQLIRNPIDMTQASWLKTGGVSVVREALFAPFIVEKTNRVSPGGASDVLEQVVTVEASTDYVVSWYVRQIDATDVSYLIYDETNGANIIGETSYFADINGSTFTRIEVPFTTPVGCTEVRLQIVRGLAGGDIYVDTAQFEAGTFATSPIPFGGAILKTSATVVDVVTYDTAYDTDAGAWRANTSGTSWYNETLNTATRGATREFPERVAIVAETNRVTIYDTTVPGNPMWMVFESLGYNGSTVTSSIVAHDGRIVIGRNISMVVWDFINDNAVLYATNGKQSLTFQTNVANRNEAPNSSVVDAGVKIANNVVNDVAITVVDGAELDASRLNMPYPTIAVATNGGISVINHDGSAANENDVVDLTNSAGPTTFYSTNVSLRSDARIAYNVINSPINRIDVGFVSNVDQSGNPITGFYNYNELTIPATLASADAPTAVEFVTSSILVGNSDTGLTIINEDSDVQSNGMVQYTTTDYASGVMPGDIRGAWMADTETGDIGAELVTNGTFDTDTDWTKGAGWSIGGGVASCDGSQVSATILAQVVPVVAGRAYIVKYTISNYVSGSIRSNFTTVPGIFRSSNGTFSEVLIAPSGIVNIELQADVGFSGDIDNVSVTEVIEDRSVKGNDLTIVNGPLTRNAVASGADLVWWEGFATTHAELPYTADLDYSTANFSNIGWIAADVDGSARTFWMRSDTAITGGSIRQQINPDGTVTFTISDDGETTPYSVTSTTSIDDGNPHHVAVGRRDNALELWIDKVLEDTIVPGGFDLTTAAYSGISESVASEDNAPTGLFFTDDGLTMYVVGTQNDSVYQYSLSTAWTVSTASFVASFDVSSETTSPAGVAFSSDGLKMFVVENATDSVFEYDLSVAWDITTASYNSVSFSVSAQEATPTCITFSTDGSKFFISGSANDTVFEYDLSVAWDLSTASYSGTSKDVSTEATTVVGVDFSFDGLKMFVIGSNIVYQYTLTTAFDVSTASYDSLSFDVSTQENTAQDVQFRTVGTEFYVVGTQFDTVFQYSITPTTVDLDNGTAVLNIGQAVDGNEPATDVKLTLQRSEAYFPTADQIATIYDFETTWFDVDALITLGGASNSVQDISYDFVLNQARVATADGVTVIDLTTRKRIEFISTEIATSDDHIAVSAVNGFMTAGTTAEAYVEADNTVRDADDVTIQDLDTLDWFTNDQVFSVIASVVFKGTEAASPELFAFNDGTANNEVVVYLNGSNEPTLRVVSGGVTQADISSGVAITAGVSFNVAIRVEADNMAISVDGAAVVSDVLGVAPVSLDTLSYGDTNAAQHLTSFEYLSRTTTDEELVTFSTDGPQECISLDPLTVNMIGTQFSPFVGECGEAGALCGEEIYCGDKVIIPVGTYPFIRNPLKVLNDQNHISYVGACGDPASLCGNDVQCGDTYVLSGYPLVNKIVERVDGYSEDIMCGDPDALCGEPDVECGAQAGFTFKQKQYIIPNDVLKWPFFVYVGGETWPETAQVDANRREEFETTILKLFPAHNWVGVLVEYV